MKAKNILMSILLVMGSIAAKAAGYPPELALVSQPVMVYNYNSVTIYYDVQNIGDYTYRGYINVFLDPDNGYCYGEKYVRVCPGRIKRVAIEIPAYRANPARLYMVMPYYTLGGELYSFTTFEYFEPLTYHWDGPRVGPYIVIHVGPRIHHYHRPASYRYYYDGFRPPMPPHGFGPGMPPPMNPMHHTYNYHHNNGGYPATNNWNNEPKPNGGASAGSATVRPNGGNESGSMSSGNTNSNNVAPGNNGSSSSIKPNTNNGSGRTGNSSGSNSSVSRPDNNSRPSGTSTGSASGRTGNSSNSRVNNNSNSSRPNGNSNSGNSNVSRPSSNSRPSGTSTSSSTGSNGRSGNSVSGSSNSNRSSGTSSSTSGRSSNSSNSSSGRSGSSGGRR
ncbi:MAG: hypothetical protein IKG95_02295 [Bacteroidales bacterium]|nr:hypothetical protein [Bacteroidales bacterium]